MRNCDKEGKVFVDRDGRMFQYILGFLRTGQLCLPDDFSEFDSLTTEVEAYEICILSKRLEDMRLEKMLVKSIEILETTVDEYINTVLKGKKEDLATLPLAAHKRYWPELEDKDSSFLKLILLDNARLGMAEVLRRNGWTCESSDFSSSSHCPSNDPNSVLSYIVLETAGKKYNAGRLSFTSYRFCLCMTNGTLTIYIESHVSHVF